jgi:hypothetical protein
VQGS